MANRSLSRVALAAIVLVIAVGLEIQWRRRTAKPHPAKVEIMNAGPLEAVEFDGAKGSTRSFELTSEEAKSLGSALVFDGAEVGCMAIRSWTVKPKANARFQLHVAKGCFVRFEGEAGLFKGGPHDAEQVQGLLSSK